MTAAVDVFPPGLCSFFPNVTKLPRTYPVIRYPVCHKPFNLVPRRAGSALVTHKGASRRALVVILTRSLFSRELTYPYQPATLNYLYVPLKRRTSPSSAG